jgi:alginate O-acetyltransferase complex protein AlgI
MIDSRAADHVWKVLAVYLAALVAFAFFRASSTTTATELLAGMIGLHGFENNLPVSALLRIAVMFAIVWGSPNTQQIMTSYAPALGRSIANPYSKLIWSPSYSWAAFYGFVLGLSLLRLDSSPEFLYFQF